MIFVSACLLGKKCRYDGRGSFSPELAEKIKSQIVIGVCPEQLGGMTTPRPAAAIDQGSGCDVLNGLSHVLTYNGDDLTDKFLKGALTVLDLALTLRPSCIYLKDRSPSCGIAPHIDPKGVERGMGVTAAILQKNGFALVEVKAKATA